MCTGRRETGREAAHDAGGLESHEERTLFYGQLGASDRLAHWAKKPSVAGGPYAWHSHSYVCNRCNRASGREGWFRLRVRSAAVAALAGLVSSRRTVRGIRSEISSGLIELFVLGSPTLGQVTIWRTSNEARAAQSSEAEKLRHENPTPEVGFIRVRNSLCEFGYADKRQVARIRVAMNRLL